MGYDRDCTLHFEGRSSRGTATLEQHDLIFRGDFRLAIPLKDITRAHAGDASLDVMFGARSARFEIGSSAAKWAERIVHPPSRLDKFGVKAGSVVMTVALTDEEFLDDMKGRGARIVTRAPRDGVEIVFYGAERREALGRLPRLSEAMKSNGALWVIRPKGQRAITEADVMSAGKRAGLVDVKVVSFSNTHTAEKFVIPVAKRAQH